MTPKAVFTTARSARHQKDAMAVAPEGLEVAMLRSPERAELEKALSAATYLVSERSGVVDEAMLAAAPDLRLILRLGELCHDIDLEAARRAGVMVCWQPQEGVLRVAEFTVLQMLALLRRLRESEDLLRQAGDGWVPRRTTDENRFAYNWTRRENLRGLHGLHIGILGLGEIGVALARRLAGWGVTLSYHRRSALPGPVEAELGLTRREPDDLLAACDILVCLLPYSEQTAGWLNAARIAAMPRGALLVSVGSGGIIDEQALAQALAAGELAGAALDTFAVEPIEAANPLLALAEQGANVLLTPHVAGGSPEDADATFAAMWDPVRDHMAGREPAGCIV